MDSCHGRRKRLRGRSGRTRSVSDMTCERRVFLAHDAVHVQCTLA